MHVIITPTGKEFGQRYSRNRQKIENQAIAARNVLLGWELEVAVEGIGEGEKGVKGVKRGRID